MSKNINLRQTALGIELGSTRIKSVLVDELGNTIATGLAEWENQLSDDGYWTYDEKLIWRTLQKSFADLKSSLRGKENIKLNTTSAIGISAMMHGLLAFDKNGKLLTPFRTWRNNNTKEASKYLSDLFKFNIPERWSIAHLYQLILDGENFVNDIDYITTLSGYITWKLTGEKSIGIGDASGMFPIDSATKTYNKTMLDSFDRLLKENDIDFKLIDVLPEIKLAGDAVGSLDPNSYSLLDKDGDLKGDIILAPPEGDAGTGMIATNCIAERTANISVGTSAFSMIVMEKALKSYYKNVDVVTTPNGYDVAMIHINNCGSEINDWVNLFKENLKLFGINISSNELFTKLFENSRKSDEDVGNLVNYGFHSGENIFDIDKGMPTFIREQDNKFNISNVIKSLLISSFMPLKYGHDFLNKHEDLKIDKILAHGGLFKSGTVAQEIISEVLDFPVRTFKTAGEGGAWGMAVLALYVRLYNKMDLQDFLDEIIFSNVEEIQVERNEKVKREVINYFDTYDEYVEDIKGVINKTRRHDEKI